MRKIQSSRPVRRLVCAKSGRGAALRVAALLLVASVAVLHPPAVATQNAGLRTSEETCLVYLAEGLQPSEPNEEAKQEGLSKRLPFDRWSLYPRIVDRLGELESKRAVPILCRMLTGPLPPHMELDLDAQTVGNWPLDKDWQEVDAARREELWGLRIEAVEALARVGDVSARPSLQRILKEAVRAIEWEQPLDKPDGPHNPLGGVAWTIGFAGLALAALGDTSGIDTQIALLERLPQGWTEVDCVVQMLRDTTGQTFGPDYETPPAMWDREVAHWQEWWAENRQSFDPEREQVLAVRNRQGAPVIFALSPNPPQSVRDYVAATVQGWPGNHTPEERAQWEAWQDWLREYAASSLDELLRVACDLEEHPDVRKKALESFLNAGGVLDVDWLAARVDAQELPQVRGVSPLRLLEKQDPQRARATVRRWLREGSGDLGEAVSALMDSPEDWPLIVSRFPDCDARTQRSIVRRFAEQGASVGLPLFHAAFESDDVELAVQGWRALQKVRPELAQEDSEIGRRWFASPEFVFRLSMELDGAEREAMAQRAVALAGEASPMAAWHYRHRIEQCATAGDLQSESAQEAWRGWVKCLNAYRQAYGRHPVELAP